MAQHLSLATTPTATTTTTTTLRYVPDLGKVTAATVADHITPHKGDYELFWHGPLQSLCAFHHNKTKQRIERKGSKAIDVEYSNACDVHGKPIDPRHPSNKIE